MKAVPVAKPESCHAIQRGPVVERSDELAERQLTLAANDGIDAEVWMCPCFRGEARVVAADDDPYAWLDRLDERDDSTRRASLKGHHRQPDELGLEIAHQLFHGASHRCLHEDQVSYGDAMMRVEVARQRRQRAVGHPNRHTGRVFEGVGHRQEQNLHSYLLTLQTIAPKPALS